MGILLDQAVISSSSDCPHMTFIIEHAHRTDGYAITGIVIGIIGDLLTFAQVDVKEGG